MKLNFIIYKNSSHKIYLQLYDAIKNIIENEEIMPNEKLPSIRQIAIKFNINTITVLKAYDLLEKHNYIYKISGKGCFVKEKNKLMSNTQKPVINNFAIMNKNINFASATPSAELYPVHIFQEIINEIFNNYGEKVFNYFSTQGLLELREIITEKLKNNNIDTSSNNIQIVSGSQQALDLIKKIIFKRKTTTIVVTNPTYYGAINTFSEITKMISVPIEKDGINIDEMEKVLQKNKVDFIYTMINFESPTGISWSTEKKRKILEFSEKYNFTIIEDDCLSHLYYYNNVSIPLKAMDTKNKVIYINSFSKLIMPGLRLGYMVVPTNLISYIIAAKFSSDISSSGLMQMALHLFLKRGYMEPHIEKMRTIFREKYELTLSLLQEIKEIEVSYIPNGGFYIWIKLPKGLNSNVFYNVLKDRNVSILPDSVFYQNEELKNDHMRLSFAAVTEKEIKTGIEIIKKSLEEFSQKKDFLFKEDFISIL
ncbi:MAG: PLP-dependent aminotransferase family protein [Fusobacteriaceae bacterium]|jgi:DNA-binding transcriptional MocR family regulator|nr:PLP-dependent aminotransferase family protein [Fusobacteriaceae bacterium]